MSKRTSPLTTAKILKQLEMLYTLSLSEKNLNLALKIKELQARSLGLFQQSDIPNISTVSDDHLQKLINQLETE